MSDKVLDEWFKKILPKISNVENDLLIQYILTLLNDKRISRRRLKKNCIDNLREFLNFNTKTFVNNLFDKLSLMRKIQKNKMYLKNKKLQNINSKNTKEIQSRIQIKDNLQENNLKKIIRVQGLETKKIKSVNCFLQSKLIGLLTGICPTSSEFTLAIYSSRIILIGTEVYLSNLTSELIIPSNSKIHKKLETLIYEENKHMKYFYNFSLQGTNNVKRVRKSLKQVCYKKTARQLHLTNLPDFRDIITTISTFFSKFGTIDIIRISKKKKTAFIQFLYEADAIKAKHNEDLIIKDHNIKRSWSFYNWNEFIESQKNKKVKKRQKMNNRYLLEVFSNDKRSGMSLPNCPRNLVNFIKKLSKKIKHEFNSLDQLRLLENIEKQKIFIKKVINETFRLFQIVQREVKLTLNDRV